MSAPLLSFEVDLGITAFARTIPFAVIPARYRGKRQAPGGVGVDSRVWRPLNNSGIAPKRNAPTVVLAGVFKSVNQPWKNSRRCYGPVGPDADNRLIMPAM